MGYEYLHAALLLHAAKKEINEENVLSVIKAAGIPADQARAKALVASLEGVNIDEAIKSAAVPVAVAAPAAAAGAAPAATGEAKKKEEEKPKEEEAAAGLASLFG